MLASIPAGPETAPWPDGTRLVAKREPAGAARPRAVVAIPVRDEVVRLRRCLEALAGQRDLAGRRLAPGSHEVLLLNNCADGSFGVALEVAARLPMRLAAVAVELPPAAAHVGWARRLAMNEAALRLIAARRGDGATAGSATARTCAW